MWLGAGQRQTAGGVGGEIAQIPSFDEFTEGRYPGVLLQGAKRGDAEPAFVLQLDKLHIRAFYPVGFLRDSFRKLLNVKPGIFIVLPALRPPLPGDAFAFTHHQKP